MRACCFLVSGLGREIDGIVLWEAKPGKTVGCMIETMRIGWIFVGNVESAKDIDCSTDVPVQHHFMEKVSGSISCQGRGLHHHGSWMNHPLALTYILETYLAAPNITTLIEAFSKTSCQHHWPLLPRSPPTLIVPPVPASFQIVSSYFSIQQNVLL